MRRVLLGLASMGFTVLALAGPASAASAQVTTFRFAGTFAEALWQTRSATSFTDTSVTAVKSTHGSELFIFQATSNFDASGNFTGATETSADVTSGFSFAIQQPLASASVSGSGLPATTCTFDVNFNLIGCAASTIDATATWTGQGPITRGVSNNHFKSDGFSETEHSNGTDRSATATGTIGGVTLTASDLAFADLGTSKEGLTAICVGSGC
jgi:hypothetical protein